LQSLNHNHSLSIERQQKLSEIIHALQRIDTPRTSETNFRTDDISDSELVNCSHEVEKTIQRIETYEEIQATPRLNLGVS
jgi:hypothetical protein